MSDLTILLTEQPSRYMIEGYNFIDDGGEFFKGNLSCFSDGRIIGSIIDSKMLEDSKLFFGFLDDTNFQLWQIQQNNSTRYLAAVYNLNRNKRQDLDFDGKRIQFNLSDNYLNLFPETLEFLNLFGDYSNVTRSSLVTFKLEFLTNYLKKNLAEQVLMKENHVSLSLYLREL